MNRYTYKGKRKDNNEWVYGDLLNWYDTENNNEHNVCIIPIEASIKNKTIRDFIVDKDTLCQCLGIKDINDKYIFENDTGTVMRYSYEDSDDYYDTAHTKPIKEQITMSPSLLCCDFFRYNLIEGTLEVTGNKFD